MDIKEMAQDIIEKIKADKDFAANFKKDPIKTVEKLLNVDLPEDQIEAIVKLVKTKVDLDKLGDLAKLAGLFK